ncbi:MAG: serine hydrolase [Candidatus Krumholzibacteria bacterium]|nr:serine hydrolase [Candidatus Krumholzibacteria bacterium]
MLRSCTTFRQDAILLSLGLMFLLLLMTVQTITGAESIDRRVDELVTAYHEHRAFEGVVLVADKGAVVYEKGFGWANREWQIPNTTDTRFLIASVTKPFTAALTIVLAERGKIDLHAAISTYLQDYRRDTGDRVTVHQLLTHSSGIPNYAVWPQFWNDNPPRMNYERAEFVSRYCSGDLVFEPGEDTQYSDANYYLLALIIEQVTEISYEKALARWIFEPLGMENSGVVREDLIIERRAYGYLKRGGTYSIPPYINYEDTQLGAGDMYASVGDLFRFDQALYDTTLLSTTFRDFLFEPHTFSGFTGMNNGYGWNVGVETLTDTKREVQIAHAPGNNAGFTTVVYRIPETRRTIIIAANVGPGPLDPKVFEMCREITHLLFGESYSIPKPSIVDQIAAVLDAQGIEAAEETYHRMKGAGGYDLDTNAMNRYGYRLLQAGRVDEAVAVFRLNVLSDPSSANAYDSLGESYMTRGDRLLAIKNYRKSLELNPSNENARKMLHKLGVD